MFAELFSRLSVLQILNGITTNFVTASAHRTFSEASPPTSRLARAIVLLVASASS